MEVKYSRGVWCYLISRRPKEKREQRSRTPKEQPKSRHDRLFHRERPFGIRLQATEHRLV
jgi:hypothetical protein